MQLELNVTLDLPPGWEFSGLWFENYTTVDHPERGWAADADYVERRGDEGRRKTILEVTSYGATAQEAIDGLPEEIRKAVAVITATDAWGKEGTDAHPDAGEPAT